MYGRFYYDELNKLIGGANMTRIMNAQILKWWATYMGWRSIEWKGGFFEWSPMGKRSIGRPRNRWRG
jgi:hypothetical protein